MSNDALNLMVSTLQRENGVLDEVFERKLVGWHTDERAWPPKRTLKMFKNWFSIEMHSVVEDLCGYENIGYKATSGGD